jgi:hypothetical protein
MALVIVGLALLAIALGVALALDPRQRRTGELWPGGLVMGLLFAGVLACYLSGTVS